MKTYTNKLATAALAVLLTTGCATGNQGIDLKFNNPSTKGVHVGNIQTPAGQVKVYVPEGKTQLNFEYDNPNKNYSK